MNTHRLCGAGLFAALTALFALTVSAPARADTVTDWNGYASTAIVATAGQPPPVAVLSFAYFFGTDRIGFSAFSNKSGTTRTFHRFSDALEESINVRVWAGI